jgi:hypothetical protein
MQIGAKNISLKPCDCHKVVESLFLGGGKKEMKYHTGSIVILLCVLLFLVGCFSSSEEDYDIRGTWNITAVDNTTHESASGSMIFSGSKESGTFYGELWGKIDDPGNYTVQGTHVTLTKANHPPDDDGMNGAGEFSDVDTVTGTFSDYQNHTGTWVLARAD